MAKYRQRLPQVSDDIFLTDGGLETTLVFKEGVDLPCFAAFVLLANSAGRQRLRDYFGVYADIARCAGTGLIAETVTWRANPDWAEPTGYSLEALADANRQSVALCEEIRAEHESTTVKMPISGCIGPRGDGYTPGAMMSVDEAADYHAWQVNVFRDTATDFVSALTLNYVNEAAGIVQAADAASMPVVISFTVEIDGNLPDGTTLRNAIGAVDAMTDGGPDYYMINCAHPTHFRSALEPGTEWVKRIRGIRANSSKCSHAELDVATTLDEGNPIELGEQFRELREAFPHMNVLGGCCGTDHRHIEAISRACAGRLLRA